MKELPQPVVGIDLGTTYSVVAHLDATGRPVSIPNAEGDLITPSVVLFDGQSLVVGKEAVKALGTEAQNVADCAKRELGQRVYHKPLHGQPYPPEAIQAWVLTKLRHDARQKVGNFSKVVITVPAYFDEVRRKATQDAGYMAGLEVIDIINEPTAAAVAFGFLRGFLSAQGEATTKQRILVYDLGGGTFDVTVMEIAGRDFIALATDGDVRLGGRDWDQRLIDMVADNFAFQHGMDPRQDPNSAGRLWRECEDAKRTMSTRPKATITCEFHGFTSRLEITREQFEQATRDLLDRTRFTAQQTLQAAGLKWPDIDRVLLVGGATRMPMVRRMLTELTNKEPDGSVAADEAVAHGAALHAGTVLARSQGQQPPFRIKNVNSHSLGVAATDAATGRKCTAVLVPRNTPLPAAAKRIFKTQKAGQKSILVQVVEGESASPEDCVQLGQCVVRNLPSDLPQHTPIEVVFRYGEDGRLAIIVTVANSDARLQHELTRENSLSPEQLDMWRNYVQQIASNGGT